MDEDLLHIEPVEPDLTEEYLAEGQRQKDPWPKLAELFAKYKGTKPNPKSEDDLQANPSVLTTLYFPRSKRVPEHLLELRPPMQKMHEFVYKRGLDGWNTTSNQATAHIAAELDKLLYSVDRYPKGNRVNLPLLFGPDGIKQRGHQADAYREDADGRATVIEIEAGTAVANNAYLKDIFEACMVDNVDYLVLAVRKLYQADKGGPNPHFQFVKRALDTLYTSDRLRLPFKGVWLIGY